MSVLIKALLSNFLLETIIFQLFYRFDSVYSLSSLSVPYNNCWALISTFYRNSFITIKVIQGTPSPLVRLLNLSFETSIFKSFFPKLLKYISIAASLFLVLNVDFVLNGLIGILLLSFLNPILNRAFYQVVPILTLT